MCVSDPVAPLPLLRPELWFGELLDRNGVTVGDVAIWAVHPGGPRILDRHGPALDPDAGTLATSRACSLIMATPVPPPSA